MWGCEMEWTGSEQSTFEALHNFISTIIKLLKSLGILFSLKLMHVCISQLYSKKTAAKGNCLIQICEISTNEFDKVL